eukprot:TRINITY_DN113510_c0_g1_i2.p1 TRINITY_DN113510_c0_g1~~TRINITY_DN113510_c0_g1_i2.p1  ORF type:complete len:252 (-),score=41.79 TRINITY_DN113510_c0_g1_i2:68-823(-)
MACCRTFGVLATSESSPTPLDMSTSANDRAQKPTAGRLDEQLVPTRSACSGLQLSRVSATRRIKCWRGAQDPKVETGAAEVELNDWELLQDGRFRGKLKDGLVVEFEGQLLGPADPGIVVGPGGVRYVLGEAAPSPSVQKEATQGSRPDWQAYITAAASAAIIAAAASVLLPVLLQGSPLTPTASSSTTPVTRTNVTIVETRKTLPDGATAKITDRTVRKERVSPGKAPVVTERTTRTEKVVRDERRALPP